jgi:HD-GYP domain-containing protein (c-di-GMP phosphodiesterase class II)/pSer/pThr/pTyr-binding forkhead associated (FHA) protein
VESSIRLRLVDQLAEDKSWESTSRLRIGRLKSLEIALDESSVSRNHAEIYVSQRGWRVRDLRSTNGTTINGSRLGAADWPVGLHDIIKCGDVTFVVESLEIVENNTVGAPEDGLVVEATGKRSWAAALEGIAFDQNRCPRPGEQFQALLRAGQHVVHNENQDDLLDNILHDAVSVLDAQRGAIVLAEGPDSQLRLRSLATGRQDVPARPAYSHSVAQRTFNSGEAVLCRSVNDDAELAMAQSISAGTMASVLCVLLRTPRRTLGVLHLDRGPMQQPFNRDDLFLADALAANVSAGIESALLFQKQRETFLSTITALAQAVELRDDYTGGHTHRVGKYSEMLALELKVTAHELYWIRMGTPLHDIGKIGIRDSILQKPGPLTAEEFQIMKTHTVKGVAILESIPEMAPAIPLVRSHHERWDGKGYPDGLVGKDIPRLARIVAVADTFDAMTSDRPYRAGMPPRKAFKEVETQSGLQFDPECAAAFLRLQDEVVRVMESNTMRMTGTAPIPQPAHVVAGAS